MKMIFMKANLWILLNFILVISVSTTAAASTPLREEVAKELVTIVPKQASISEAWDAVREAYWPDTFDAVSASAISDKGMLNKNSILTISTASANLAENKGSGGFAQQFIEGNFNGIQNTKEAKALTAFYYVASIDANSGGHAMPHFVQAYSIHPKPTRGDLLIFALLDDAYDDVENTAPLNKDEFSEWCSLARGKNPFFRLLALRRFSGLGASESQSTEFYDQYMGEMDPVIIEQLFATVGGIQGHYRLQYINDFISGHQGKLSPEIITRLQRFRTDIGNLVKTDDAIHKK
jgi:hypothetical protein